MDKLQQAIDRAWLAAESQRIVQEADSLVTFAKCVAQDANRAFLHHIHLHDRRRFIYKQAAHIQENSQA